MANLDRNLLSRMKMQGLITERDFQTAERWFPGIRGFYQALTCKPMTFLELVWQYERRSQRFSSSEPAASSPPVHRQVR